MYSPRVEGVHLRFGPVARGGLRWSDRRVGLPHRDPRPGQGAGGEERGDRAGRREGRVRRQAPAGHGDDREAFLAEGIACYRMFISGLLDLTDNLRAGKVVPARDVVRYDGDDTYLVVAADKGTATFSDIANEVAARATASGSATRSPPAARSATTTRPWASPPAARGRASSGTSASWAWTPRPRTSRSSASATWPVTCSATACCSPSTSAWSPRSTTCTCSSTRTRTRPPPSPSGAACSSCRVPAGTTTTGR